MIVLFVPRGGSTMVTGEWKRGAITSWGLPHRMERCKQRALADAKELPGCSSNPDSTGPLSADVDWLWVALSVLTGALAGSSSLASSSSRTGHKEQP